MTVKYPIIRHEIEVDDINKCLQIRSYAYTTKEKYSVKNYFDKQYINCHGSPFNLLLDILDTHKNELNNKILALEGVA